MKRFFAIGFIFLSLSIAYAKSYNFYLSKTTKAGTAQLAAGPYTVKLAGSLAIFTDEKDKQYTTPVKVETGDKNYDKTSFQTVEADGVTKLTEIDLGGTNTKIEFGQ